MNIYVSNRLYMKDSRVYLGTTELNIHNQRGRLFVKYKGKQVNIKHIPTLPEITDPVFGYIFNGGFQAHPCPAMGYWIMRHRMKVKISVNEYKRRFIKR